MRDPNRLDKFYEDFRDIHKKNFPDWRFGQLISNFLGWYVGKYGDPFFPEEDKMIEKFKEYTKEIKGGR